MKTTIDYLKFRTRTAWQDVIKTISPSLGSFSDLLVVGPSEKGKDGWRFRRSVYVVDVLWIVFDYGGESQRDWVRATMTGKGCELVQDWPVLEGLVDALQDAEIRRLDVAYTTVKGEVTHAKVLRAHKAGKFKTGGRNPELKEIRSTARFSGKTAYIGSRTGFKYLRCYEKGLEIVKGFVQAMQSTFGEITSGPERWTAEIPGFIGEHVVSDVYRVEVEFKAVDGHVIPWTWLCRDRDQVFAGSYPFCAAQVPEVEPMGAPAAFLEMRARRALLEQMENLRRSYGKTLSAAVVFFGPEKALEMLTAENPSQHLVEAGVLMFARPVEEVAP